MYDFSTPVTEDLTLYAKWESQYVTVSFDSMGGSAVASQTIIKGGHPSVPVNPERDGYVFSHWYLTDEADAYDFGKSVSSDITLKAAWTEVEPKPQPGTVTGVVKLEDGWELTSNNMDAVATTPHGQAVAKQLLHSGVSREPAHGQRGRQYALPAVHARRHA